MDLLTLTTICLSLISLEINAESSRDKLVANIVCCGAEYTANGPPQRQYARVSTKTYSHPPVIPRKGSACLNCACCIAIAECMQNKFLKISEEIGGKRGIRNIVLKSPCDSCFSNFRLREVNGLRYLGRHMKGAVPVQSLLDGKWDETLTELCKIYRLFYDDNSLYDEWFDTGGKMVPLLCERKNGVLRACWDMLSNVQSSEKFCFEPGCRALYKWLDSTPKDQYKEDTLNFWSNL